MRGAPWWRVPLVIGLVSRAWGSLLVVGFGTAAWPILVSPPAAGPATMWDGAWYLEIARFGYHAAPFAGGFHDIAFWPAWPTLLRGLLWLIPFPPDLVAGLVANALSIAALVLWARVLEHAFGRSTARYGIALVAFSPSAFVLSMGYSEPLFLLLGALFFLSAEGVPARSLLAALAQATRLTGFALADRKSVG
jgi:Gpi18-like mannosyltransferase